MAHRQSILGFAAVAAVIGATDLRAQAPSCAEHCLAILNVNVISMAPGTTVDTHVTVLIGGNRIQAIGPSSAVRVPETYKRIDGSGKWLIPGLSDMHMHFLSEPIAGLDFTPTQILSPYIAHGVLQVADLAASKESNAVRDAVEAGEILAPMMVTAAMVDGAPRMRPGSREIATPQAAKAVIAGIAAEGFDYVKVYSRLDLESFRAVLAAAQREDIGVIGHIPGGRKTQPQEALLPGFAVVAHAEEFAWRSVEKSDADIAAIVARMKETDAALTSTLLLNERIHAQTSDPSILDRFDGIRMLHPIELLMWFEDNPYIGKKSPERIRELAAVADFNARLVRALDQAGVPILAGTDAAFIPGLAPGLSLHEELAALVAAGLTPYDALAAATVTPATWLGVIGDRGTVEVGKRANLLLLDADPLAAIENTRKIDHVLFNGRHFARPELDAMLTALDTLYAPYRPHFSPGAAAALGGK